MKKAFSMVLAALISLFPACLAATAEINLSAFDGNTYKVERAGDGTGYVTEVSGNCNVVLDEDGLEFAILVPGIMAYSGKNGILMLSIHHITFINSNPAAQYASVSSVVFTVDGVSYTFDSVTDQVTIQDGQANGVAVLYFGRQSYAFAKAVAENQDQELRMKIIKTVDKANFPSLADAKDETFVIDDMAKANIALLYNGFVDAGGLRQSDADLAAVETEANPITIQ